MQDTSHLENHPASPEYVLEVIRDSYRQQLQFDPEAEPDVELTFDSTISEWRAACDLISWKPLGRALNREWQLEATESEWKKLLEPQDKKTLRALCSFVAARITQPSINPSRLLGATCHSGGIFLAIREILKNAGANVEGLRPSSPVAPYLNDYVHVFLGAISRAAPNQLPLITIHSKFRKLLLLTFFLGLISASTFIHLSLFGLAVASGLLAILSMIVAFFGPAPHAEFSGVITFRDLVERMHEAEGINGE